jgi:hypothetical protein
MSWLSLWHQYWSWTGGNVGAMPLQALITGVCAFVFRGPLGRLLGGDALKEAAAARRIAASLYEHHTGRTHPDAPDRESEAK